MSASIQPTLSSWVVWCHLLSLASLLACSTFWLTHVATVQEPLRIPVPANQLYFVRQLCTRMHDSHLTRLWFCFFVLTPTQHTPQTTALNSFSFGRFFWLVILQVVVFFHFYLTSSLTPNLFKLF